MHRKLDNIILIFDDILFIRCFINCHDWINEKNMEISCVFTFIFENKIIALEANFCKKVVFIPSIRIKVMGNGDIF